MGEEPKRNTHGGFEDIKISYYVGLKIYDTRRSSRFLEFSLNQKRTQYSLIDECDPDENYLDPVD